MRALLVLLLVTACGARAHRGATPPAGDEITLYRDDALVSQRVDVEVPPASTARVKVLVPPGLEIDQIVVLDRDLLTISELSAAQLDRPEGSELPDEDPPPGPKPPTEVTFTVAAPHAGHYVLHLGYVTDTLPWDAAYTMTTTPARDRVTVRGAVAIRNESGIAFHDARLFVVDAPIASWRGRLAEQLGEKLLGAADPATAVAQPADLGQVTLGLGETRLPLLADDPPRAMRSVLVYDPIGTTLDHKGASPVRDAATGITPAPTSRISESFEISRATAMRRSLPGGPVRLLEREPDGSLSLLGEARVFDDATRVAEVDTIAIGTADGVSGRRERRDLSIDDDTQRLVEEFVLTITNKRPRPVDVVLREHLYRGETWALAYYSVQRAEKEGPQQISLRTVVPANSEAKVLYVVVYSWADPIP
jgi:hypothetical protein